MALISHNEISKIKDELILSNVVVSVDTDSYKKNMSETLILVKLQNNYSVKVIQKYIPKDILLRTLWHKLKNYIYNESYEKQNLCTSIQKIIDMKLTSQVTREKYNKLLNKFKIKYDDDLPLSSLKTKHKNNSNTTNQISSIVHVATSVTTQDSTKVTSPPVVTTLVIDDVVISNKKRKITNDENEFEIQEKEYVIQICKNIKKKIKEHRDIKINEISVWQDYVNALTSSLIDNPHIITFEESKKIEVNLELLQKETHDVFNSINCLFEKYQNWKKKEVRVTKELRNIYNTYNILLMKYQDILDDDITSFLQSYKI